jgi:flagellar biosynthesis/type III secretory pathway chaperone
MKFLGKQIEALLHDKIMLYQDLKGALVKEKQILTDANVDALWAVSDQKQVLAARVDAKRREILAVLKDHHVPNDMTVSRFSVAEVIALLPEIEARVLGPVKMTIDSLKTEIHAMAADNKRFVEQYLSVLDDLMGILTGTDHTGVYHRNRPRPTGPVNRMLHKEV